jgi:hypothetical protein
MQESCRLSLCRASPNEDKGIKHRAEKWEPVFRDNDAATKTWSVLRDLEIA